MSAISRNGVRRNLARRGRILLDVFSIWLFLMFLERTDTATDFRHLFIGDVSLELVALPLGNFIALAAVGFVSAKMAGVRPLVDLGLASAVIGLGSVCLGDAFGIDALLIVSRVFMYVTSATLTLAYCEHIAEKDASGKALFLVMFCMLYVCGFFLRLQFSIQVPYPPELLAVLSVCLHLVVRRCKVGEPPKRASNEKFPVYAQIALLFFGVLPAFKTSFGSLVFGDAENLILGISGGFVSVWTAGVVVLGLVALAVLLLTSKKPPAAFLVLLPFVSFGLLIPPFAYEGPSLLLAALSTLNGFCTWVIWCAGPPHATKEFRIGRVKWVFWKRSYVQVGLVLGFVVSNVVPSDVFANNAAFLHSLACAIAIVAASVMFGWLGNRGQMVGTSGKSGGVVSSIALQYGLTARETEVFALLAQGYSLPYVQKALHIAPGTASTHSNHIYQKLGINKREELIALVQDSPEEDAAV